MLTLASTLTSAACSSLDIGGLTSVERNFQQRPYVGAGILISQLDPGVRQFDELSLDEEQGAGGSLTLGYDLTSRWAVEGHLADLGEASLDPDGSVGYQVAGASALLYGINEARDRARREGLSFYGRAGVGTLDSDSDLPVEVLNNVHLVLGAGLEYGLSNGLASRFELVSHDSDANYVQLGLIYRFGGKSPSRGQGARSVQPTAEVDSAGSSSTPSTPGTSSTSSTSSTPGTPGTSAALNTSDAPDDALGVSDTADVSDASDVVPSKTFREFVRPEPSPAQVSNAPGQRQRSTSERPANGLLIQRRPLAPTSPTDSETAVLAPRDSRLPAESPSSTLQQPAPETAAPQREAPESGRSEPEPEAAARELPRLGTPRQGAPDQIARERAVTGLLIDRRPAFPVDDDDNDGVENAQDRCPDTREGRPVDQGGCDVFDGAIEGVTFQIASNRLTDGALGVLSEVAFILKAYPDIRVSIDAHTDDRGDARSNLLLSKRRALEVTRYLVDQGIAGNRLVPKAFGETQPVGSNDTSDGRRANRRVEFRILE